MSELKEPKRELTPDERRELLRQILLKKSREPRVFPLSLGQEALWFIERLDPGRPTYGFYPALRVRGRLDLVVLEKAFQELVRRHDVFRTTFPEVEGEPVQRVEPPGEYRLPIVDLSGWTEDEREAECRRLVDTRVPIDVQNGPLIRAQVVRMGPEDHVVSLHIHHIVFDGWSLGVLAREVAALYSAFSAGRPSPLPPLELQFADFATWQRKYLRGETLEQMQNYWRRKLSGLTPLDMPTDHPRPPVRTSRGATLPIAFTTELTDAVLDFSRREHVTPFMTLLAGFQEVLRRYSGQEDFAIGTPTANRRQKAFEPLIGYFINMLVLRADLSGDPTFRQLVQRVRDTQLDVYQHQELTLDKIVEAVAPPRDLSRHPLFQVLFVVQNNPRPRGDIPGLQLSPLGEIEPARSAKFEISLPLRLIDQRFVGKLNFNTDLFTMDTITRLSDHYQMLLAEALANPDRPLSQLKLLREHEAHTITVDWNRAADFAAPSGCLHELFETQVARSPQAVAIVDGERQWTYAELNERANQVAHALRRHGVGPDVPVAVRLPRSAEIVATLLGVFKAGGAYLPLDPQWPADRVEYMVRDAQVTTLVTQRTLPGELPSEVTYVLDPFADEASLADEPRTNPSPLTTVGNLAYVIYTSGSTGRPKGVMIEHRALVNYVFAAAREYEINAADRVLQFASVSFDAHAEEIYTTLTHGATLVMRPADALDSFEQFCARCSEAGVTVLSLPTAFWHELTADQATSERPWPASLRLVIIGGERARPEIVATWFERDSSRIRLLNTYGPTETTVVATSAELRRGDGGRARVPIGRPLGNMRAYVLDKHLRPVPVGVPGELFVGGASVARGYLGRDELTAERFLADPFASLPEARMYRTGDVVRWLSDGRLEFVGRADDQVKIRGFRIEPAEVEQVLGEHPSVTSAAVVVRERAASSPELVAYTVGRFGPLAASELRRFLRERLPEYMIPAHFVALDQFPVNTSGKIDRRALPEPTLGMREDDAQYVEPRTERERQLAVLWKEILEVSRVGSHDSFFELGGNSLLAIRLTARIRAEFEVEVPLVALFTAPTLSALAERIDELAGLGVRPAQTPIPRVSREQGVVLSSSQQLFWTVIQMFPNQPISNIFGLLVLRGELDLPTFRRTLNEVVRRHESLRTYFGVNAEGEPRQFVLPPWEVDVPLVDLSHLPEAERMDEVRQRARKQCSQPFRIDEPPLFRVELFRLSEREHALVTTITHIIFDGWSLQVLVREVSEIYEAYRAGLPVPFAELSVQYPDYAAWEVAMIEGPEFQRLLNYWRRQLSGSTNPELPFKQAVPKGVRHVRDHFHVVLPDDYRPRIEQFARHHGVTIFTTLLAVYKTLLHRYCRVDDVTIAMPVANRGRAETQRMIGDFINTIFVRTYFHGGPTFEEVMRRVQATYAEGVAHEAMPLPLLVKDLIPDYDPSRFPISQVMFNYLQGGASGRVRKRRELEIEVIPPERDPISTRSDLVLNVTDERKRVRLTFKYDSTILPRAAVEQFARHYRTLLDAVLADPGQAIDQIDLLLPDERRRILVEWNRTEQPLDAPPCVHQHFEEQVRLRPEARAVVFEGESLTYGELNARANQFAYRLRELGVGIEDRVGLCLERSLDLPVAMLGIMKAGAAYVALDPEYPRDRLEFMATDSEPRVIVTTRELDARLGAAPAPRFLFDVEGPGLSSQPTQNLDLPITGENALYIIYTSGSTGVPKGAINLHKGLVSRFGWERSFYRHQPGDRFLAKTPLSFDPSVIETFRPLATGGLLVLAKPGGQRDPNYLAELIEREQIAMTSFVPSMLRVFLEQDELASKCRSLRRVTCGGESMTRELVELFYQRLDAKLYNMYGPTETTISVSYYECRPNDEQSPIPIGRPMSNSRLYVLDERRQPLPVGVPGELYIGGEAVGRGYWNRPELSAERFVADPFVGKANATMYKTGDLCYCLPDGNVVFLGRIDSQVKIRGGRVELGEVESRLNAHPQVAASAVIAKELLGGELSLVAYVVPRDPAVLADSAVLIAELREFVQTALPAFMTPSEFGMLAELPMLPNGKLNRAALPAVAIASAAKTAAKYEPPAGELEELIAKIWQETLRRPQIGRHDEFFNLGGSSLQAVRVMRRIGEERRIATAVADLFEARTIAALAQLLQDRPTLAPSTTETTSTATGPSQASGASAAEPAESTTCSAATPPADAESTSEPVLSLLALKTPATSDIVPSAATSLAATAPSDSTAPVVAAKATSPEPTAATAPTRRYRRWLAPLRAAGERSPLYCIHGLGGHIAGFLPLAKKLREGRPVYGLQAQGLEGADPPHARMEDMAACYMEEIRDLQPEGPYFISGWSLGGLIALEVARRLHESGSRVALLAMYDTYLRVSNRDVPEMSDAAMMLRIAPRLGIPLVQLQALNPQQQWDLIAERAGRTAGVGVEEIRRLADTCRAHMGAVARFQPKTYMGTAMLFRCERARQELDARWSEICPRLRVARVPGDHYSMLQSPHVDVLAARLDAELAVAEAAAYQEPVR